MDGVINVVVHGVVVLDGFDAVAVVVVVVFHVVLMLLLLMFTVTTYGHNCLHYSARHDPSRRGSKTITKTKTITITV